MSNEAKAVLDYWKALGTEGQFRRDDKVDAEIAEKFGKLHETAAKGGLGSWTAKPESCLALIILLDQFSRNLFRDDPRAFAQDPAAVEVAREALAAGFDNQVDAELRGFFYMPFMHSESIVDQRRCITLFHAASGPDSLKYAIEHHDIIERFGRFPHRNPVLGRQMTPTEQAYLDDGGFGS